jgi:hypothetical protein
LHLPQQEIQRTVQAPSSNTNDTLKVATVVQQIIELSEAVTKRQNNRYYKNGTSFNETKWLLEFTGRSKR